MVADGMGGAAAGELASSMAVDVVMKELRERWCTDAVPADATNFAAALRAATEAANERIHAYATAHPENRGMGTTATVAGLLHDTLFLAQVGDSRAYLLRDGVARQLTKDQSLMQKLLEAGEITEEEAETSDRRNIILQALGPEPNIRIDLTHQPLRRGDVLVLCSDGLSGQMRAEDIAQIAEREPDLARLSQALIDRANAAGGPDNITVVVARFDGEGLEEARSSDPVGHQVYAIEGEPPPEPDDFDKYMHMVRTGPTPISSIREAMAASERATRPSHVPRLPEPRESRRAYVYVAVFAALVALAYFAVTRWLV
jgi:protein phosphatase